MSDVYLNFYFNGFNEEEIESNVSKNYDNIPWCLILACTMIVFTILLYSYIVYILNYYETFFLIKIINLNSKEFEDYLKHFEELKYKLKNLENEDNQKTLENDEINDTLVSEGNNNNHKLGRQYTKIDNNNLENDELHNNSKEDNNNENMINNDNNNIQTNTPKNDENKKTKESSKKKKKGNKKDRVKKIKLIEQKNLK